jgi:hypothetical protein
MQMTAHAQKRSQQRALPDCLIGIIVDNGVCENAPGGAQKYFLGNRQCQKAISELKHGIQLIERARRGAVIADGNIILTAFKG